jgi:hypothetical protein
MRRRLPEHEVRVERRRVLDEIGVKDRLLVPAAGLALVERDDRRDGSVHRAAHAFVVQLLVVVAVHGVTRKVVQPSE